MINRLQNHSIPHPDLTAKRRCSAWSMASFPKKVQSPETRQVISASDGSPCSTSLLLLRIAKNCNRSRNEEIPGGDACRSRSELRELLVETGLQILIEEGLGSGAERLTFKRVLDRIEADQGIKISNASVIGRIWKNMEEYQEDVLATATEDENDDEIDQTLAAVEGVLEQSDLSTLDGRERTITQLCRVAGGTHAGALARSPTWHLFIGIWGRAASASGSERRLPHSNECGEDVRARHGAVRRHLWRNGPSARSPLPGGLRRAPVLARGAIPVGGMRPSGPDRPLEHARNHETNRTERRAGGVDAVFRGL